MFKKLSLYHVLAPYNQFNFELKNRELFLELKFVKYLKRKTRIINLLQMTRVPLILLTQ